MEPKIVTRDAFNVVGMQYIGNNAEGQISKMWDEFIKRASEIKNALNDGKFYGLEECICEGECKCEAGGDFSYIACLEVSSLDDIPDGMVGRTIPAGKYAVFTYRGSLEALPKAFEDIYTKWLGEAGLTPSASYAFEYYDERFKGFAEGSEMDIYVPVG